MNVLKRLATCTAGWNNGSAIIRACLSRVKRVRIQIRHRKHLFYVADNDNKVIGSGNLNFFVHIDLCFGLIKRFFDMFIPYTPCFDPAQITGEDSVTLKLELL